VIASFSECRDIHVTAVTLDDDRARFNVVIRCDIERELWGKIKAIAQDSSRGVPYIVRHMIRRQLQTEKRLREQRIADAKARQASEEQEEVEKIEPRPSAFGELVAAIN
jgi:hypothetical protein